MSMILAIDGYEANAATRVGVGRFAYELIAHLYKLFVTKKTAFEEVRVYVPGAVSGHMPKETKGWTYVVLSPTTLWTFWALPQALLRTRPLADVVFSPTHYIPRFVSIPRVMAIMDVSYLEYPELFRKQDVYKLTHWTRYSALHAKEIITISEFSKNAIIQSYGVPAGTVSVCYPALPDSIGKKQHGMSSSKPSFSMPKHYLLSVGTLQPRKNYERLIEAFATMPQKDLSLCIVGKKGWLYESILSAPERFGVGQRVQFLDFVDDRDLPWLYQHAKAFVLPSLYEGFGLPVLEAMSYGIPVVVSRISSLPEIAGKAGIYVDPMNIQSIADGLITALDESPGARKKRIALGKSIARSFTWERAATKALEVLTRVAKKGAVS